MNQPPTTNHQSLIILAIDTATNALVVAVGQSPLCHSDLPAGRQGSASDEESQVVSSTDNRTRDPSATPQDDKGRIGDIHGSDKEAMGVPILASHFSIVDRKHLELSTIKIEETVKKAGIKLADLSAIVVGLGPGSLIGARVGVVVAKTLAQVLKAPLIGISTLDVIAAGPSKKIGKELYPTPEALIKLGFDKLKKGQFSSLYELEPIYLREPV